MPELPDIEAYRAALQARAVGRVLEGVRLRSVFLLRTVDPPLAAFEGRVLSGTRRIGKRLVLAFASPAPPLFLVIHLMLAGRLTWAKPGAGLPGRRGLAAFDVADGTLLLTEAGTRRMASLHAVAGEDALLRHDPGGLEPLEASEAAFATALRSERHTLKRALTAPHLLSGIGGAYADEILHAARLSPVALTTSLDDEAFGRLHRATREVLTTWTHRLGEGVEEGRWPKITAFQPGMAVHGRYREPCPRCGDPVQRIRYADRETDYCATCQTGGTVLADRSLSRLLGKDWPRSLAAWEERIGSGSKT
jgi:formamidopyrimidine-DNA glycosylase